MKKYSMDRLMKNRSFISEYIGNPESVIMKYGLEFDNEKAVEAFYKKADQLFETTVKSIMETKALSSCDVNNGCINNGCIDNGCINQTGNVTKTK